MRTMRKGDYVRDGARGERLATGQRVHAHEPGALLQGVVIAGSTDVVLLDVAGEQREFLCRHVHDGSRCDR